MDANGNEPTPFMRERAVHPDVANLSYRGCGTMRM
jgi:hypothetical protein